MSGNKPFSFKKPGNVIPSLPATTTEPVKQTVTVETPAKPTPSPKPTAKAKPKKDAAQDVETRSEKVIIYITKSEKKEMVEKLDGRSASFKLHQGFKKWLADL